MLVLILLKYIKRLGFYTKKLAWNSAKQCQESGYT